MILFNNINTLIKKLTNNNSENHKCISMYNHLNILEVMKNVNTNGPVYFTWESNKHKEKGEYNEKKTCVEKSSPLPIVADLIQ